MNAKPVFWMVVIVISLVGAVYFVAAQQQKPTHLEAPEGEALALEPT